MQEKIREELQNILKNEPHNYSKVLELSNELSKFDKDNVRFSVDAGIIDRLGKELVARHETAVSELVKNAYDADATRVIITFKESYKTGGTLEIEDNGLGMTKEQLINGFMRLSSSDKLHFPHSPRYDRKRAGKKGIGRFSAQRLGKRLTIVTQTLEAKQALKVIFYWDNFMGDKELSFITNEIEYIDKIKDEGTTLYIDQLRDSWTEAQIKRVYRYASETIQPFPISKTKKDSKAPNDPGFKLKCIEEYDGKKNTIADENKIFFEHALAEIKAKVNNEGLIYLTLKSNHLNYHEKDILLNPNNPYKVLKNVSLKVYYFIYGNSLIPKQIETLVREKAKVQGGIRLYRNGFRVLPYGEVNNDWLGLDASVRRRSVLPVHSNINFFGVIEVNNDYGEQFEETSSREGLIENDALKELEDFGYKSLVASVNRIASERGRKLTTGQENWKPEPKPEDTIEEVIEELEEIVKEESKSENTEEKSESTEKLLELAEKLKEANSEQKRQSKELLEEKNLLRVLAALGITIGEFIHEIKQYQGALQHDIKYLSNTTKMDEVKSVTETIKSNLEGLSTYTSYFDEAFSENIQRELKPIEIRSVVSSLQKTLKADMARRNIIFEEPTFDGYHLYTIPMHKSEWASILFNLYTNSRKAIQRANVAGKIWVTGGKVYNNLYLEFSDNGDGIPIDKRDKIFEAFYTTSLPVGKVAKSYEEMTGTGLGLKIVRDIITGYGGKIFVKEPIKGYSTTIRIELPRDKEGFKRAI